MENIAWNYYGMNELDNSIAMAKETMNIGDTQDDRRLSENL